jgi:hypothetical protein
VRRIANHRAGDRVAPVTADVATLRGVVLEIMAAYGDGATTEVVEPIESLRVAWLIHVIEERFTVELELTDSLFEELTTVDGATNVLVRALGGGGGASER